jgi:hypothetical protein
MPLDRLVEVAYVNTRTNNSKLSRYLTNYLDNYGWIGEYYMTLCKTGEKVGSNIGGALGFTAGAVTPIIAVGAGLFVLEKVASKIMTRLK